jgi:hypothetical protein
MSDDEENEDDLNRNEEESDFCDVCGAEADSFEADENWVLISAGNSRDLVVLVCRDCAQSKEKLQRGFTIFVEELPDAMQGELTKHSTQADPVCADAGSERPGLGCPDCKRFEVRIHPSDCAEHGEHQELMCCWCGALFVSFHEIEHDHGAKPTRDTVQ